MTGSNQRRLVLEGTENVRDLGGYPTEDGKLTKWGKYFRGDSLHQLSVSSQKKLLETGIRSVIDLRYPTEGPYRFHESVPIEYRNIPLHNPEQLKTEKPKNLVELYCLILDTKQEQIYEIMKHFVSAENDPVLFHCKAGKDRTGVIAALLLDLAGVPHHLIAEDYALTAKYRTISEETLNDRPSFMNKSQYESLLQCSPEFMLEFLEYLTERYQNAAEYLKKIGLHREDIRVLKANFTVDE